MRCPRCGHENDDNAKFCSNCGQRFVSSEDMERMAQARQMRRVQFNMLTNRLLMYASILSLILVFVSVFLPTLSWPYSGMNVDLGGMGWFINVGWNYLKNGDIAVGPFYTTFILYIIDIAATFGLGTMALTSIFKSFFKKTPFKASSYIILIIIINLIYQSIFMNFYYEYYSIGNKYYATSTGWGLSLLDYARLVFFLPFLVNLSLSGIFASNRNQRLIVLLTVISSYFTLTNYSDFFTSTGLISPDGNEYYLYGALRYLSSDAFRNQLLGGSFVTIMGVFIFALIALLSSAFTLVYVSRSIYKTETVNTKVFLALAITQFLSMVGIVVCSMLFGKYVGELSYFINYRCYFNLSLIMIIIYNTLMLVFAITIFFKNQPIKEETHHYEA